MRNYKWLKVEFNQLLSVVVFTLVALMSLDVVPTMSASTDTTNTKYVAGTVYTGEYKANALYYRHNKNQPWMRWSKTENYQQDVTCISALASLGSTGVWIGNLGPRGVCGATAEPAIFVIGNYLNQNK